MLQRSPHDGDKGFGLLSLCFNYGGRPIDFAP
jgi:hypothetical protein